jgi:ferritin-like protein
MSAGELPRSSPEFPALASVPPKAVPENSDLLRDYVGVVLKADGVTGAPLSKVCDMTR